MKDSIAAPVQPPAPPSPHDIARLRAWVDQQSRLYKVAAPLLIKNTQLCKRKARHLLGLTAKTKYSYSNELAMLAEQALGLDERLVVVNVLPESGAEHSGVRPGDILLAIEGKTLPSGPKAEENASQIVSAAMKGRSTIMMTLMRHNEKMDIKVPLTHACGFSVELGDTDIVNSFADGHRVMITRGMLAVAKSDTELAYMLAKELAHNALARSARPSMGAMIDSFRFSLAGLPPGATPNQPKPYSPVLDATADKLSLYMLARAGYDISDAVSFWKRLAAAIPATDGHGHTALHPSTAYRLSVMTQVTRVIKAKQKARKPLLP